MIQRLALTALLTLTLPDSPASTARAERTTITVRADKPGKPISRDLFGVFFEDLNYAADGGLYAELVQNRSFEYSPAARREWSGLTAWQLVRHGGGRGSVAVEEGTPLHVNNPHYAVLTVESAGAGVGLKNEGFDGVAVRAGEEYEVSLFARQIEGEAGPLRIRLESRSGDTLGEVVLDKPAGEWRRSVGAIRSKASVADARVVVLATAPGRVALDMVSLFPRATFRNRPNGLRADLAQAIADLHPKFVRFPGGCLVHGDGLGNMYRWKDTIGPVEQRKGQHNRWGYYQSVGLGYFEYFQFCEDIGAKPLPVIPAGVCCQFSRAVATAKWGQGQQGLPMSDMPAYVQEVLDLIEYANGPATSKWGAKRAAAGHPGPFRLQYLGVGNEDHITPVFEERFRLIHEAVKSRHPKITVIGTVGPSPSGEDYDRGWKFANAQGLSEVDEHYYETPEWFLTHLGRYDAYDRARSKVYVGEYAAHDTKRRATLRSALAEAAYMTGLERNGDVVQMASYAPLLGKVGHTQWDPDLIYFTNTAISPTINYYVQQMFSRNAGDCYLPNAVGGPTRATDLAVSSVRDSETGDLILKLVNTGSAPRPLHIVIVGVKGLGTAAAEVVLTGPPLAVNAPDDPMRVVPKTATVPVSPAFDYELPAHSLAVIRLNAR
ncbi:MAG: alpha-L-arabinofuranosidase C-terminal domain-containing protein [Candidatus Limnocylindrales bacterium]